MLVLPDFNSFRMSTISTGGNCTTADGGRTTVDGS
jgi:hypothetical protein